MVAEHNIFLSCDSDSDTHFTKMSYRGSFNQRGGQCSSYLLEYLSERRETEIVDGMRNRRGVWPSFSKKSKAASKHAESRLESYRDKKAPEITEKLVSDLHINLLCGEVVKAKNYQTVEKTVPIPVSTRGVGFSTQETFTRVLSVHDNINNLNQMTVQRATA